jgi:O-antigen ligase
MGSRQPAQWLRLRDTSLDAAYQDGHLLDRIVYLVFIGLAIAILMKRSVNVQDVLARNLALSLLLVYTLASVLWSDFPFIALKRWVRDLGHYLMVLVVLSDPRPAEAIQTVLRRLFYFLITLSIVFIKYYPDLGRSYSSWTGTALYQGVTTSKNTLGVLCLLSAIFFLWDTIGRWPARKERRTKKIIAVNIAFLGMTFWLLRLANSATSTACLMIACAIILYSQTRSMRRNPRHLKILLPTAVGILLFLEFAFEISTAVITALGRDTSLTGRTGLWTDLLGFAANPLLGEGYESFWLGARLEAIWQLHPFRPNQAHNGYLEIYLNLGIVGLCLLAAVMIQSCRRIYQRLATMPHFASLALAVWTVLLIASVTEAIFKFVLPWSAFLMLTIAPVTLGRQVVTAQRLTHRSSRAYPRWGSREPAAAPRPGRLPTSNI